MNFNALGEMIQRAFLCSLIPTMIVFGWYCYKVHTSTKAKCIAFLAIYYFVTLGYVTIYRNGIHMFQVPRYPINVVPLLHLFEIIADAGILVFLYNVIGNLVWFIPLGMLLPQYQKNITIQKVIAYAFLLSTSIEVLQFVLQAGTSDVDDVLLNVVGSIIGYIIFQLVHKIALKRQEL